MKKNILLFAVLFLSFQQEVFAVTLETKNMPDSVYLFSYATSWEGVDFILLGVQIKKTGLRWGGIMVMLEVIMDSGEYKRECLILF